jgi:hypothetical protein
VSDIVTADIVQAITDRLATEAANVGVYHGEVPEDLPCDSTQRAYPYAVLWGTAGMSDQDAEDLSGGTEGSSVSETHITIASGNPEWTLRAAGAVRKALDHWQPLPTMERLRDSQTWAPVLLDTEVLPNRWFVLLVFRAAYI